MKDRNVKVLLYITGCIIFLSLPLFLAPDFPKSLNIFNSVPTQRDLIAYAVMICFFYLNYFVLIPKFYFAKKYFIFFSIVFFCFALISLVPSVLIPYERNYQSQHETIEKPPPPPPNQNSIHRQPPPGFDAQKMQPPQRVDNYLFLALHYIFIFLALILFSLILKINNRLKLLEKERLHAELLYLKAQINPHFLFNTLNNIYSLAIEKSDQTPNAVLELSAMMRYVINDTGKDFVPLQKDIDYINSYIELQLMRFQHTIDLRFVIKGETGRKKIAPLILIPFIENAFKYGVNTEEISKISISIGMQGNNLQMLVENNKVAIGKPMEARTGLGIENTKNRLQLLYPGRHELMIKDENNKFYVSLLLILK